MSRKSTDEEIGTTEDIATADESEPKQRKRYTKKLKEEEIEIEEKDGSVNIYILRELGGADRDGYIDLMNGRMRNVGPDGKGQLTSYKGIQTALLAKSLFMPDGKPMPQKDIEALPGSQQTDLYYDALKLSALDKDAEARAKNVSKASD